MKRSKLVIRPAEGLPPHVHEAAVSNIEHVIGEFIDSGLELVVKRKYDYTIPNIAWDELEDADRGAIVRHLDDVTIACKDHPGRTAAEAAKDYPIRFVEDVELMDLPPKKAAKFARRFIKVYGRLSPEECSQYQAAYEKALSAILREEEREVR